MSVSSASLGQRLRFVRSALSLRMETQDVLHLLLCRWTKTLKSEGRLALSSQAQNVVERVAASKLETQGLVSVIASSLTGQRFRRMVICCSPFLDSERMLICYCLTLAGRRLRTRSVSVPSFSGLWLRTVSVNVFSIASLRLRTEVFLLVSLWTCQRLRTREGTFISFRWGGDCNLALLHFQAVIGCFHQSGGGAWCGPPFYPSGELICIVQTHI